MEVKDLSVIPSSVTTIGRNAFSGCSGFTSMTIPNNITSIELRAFSGCTDLTSVTIPKSITSIGLNAFDGCTGLRTVTSYIVEPFNIGSFAFGNEAYRQGTLFVPAGTKDLYTRFDGWRQFLKIVEMDDEGETLTLAIQDAQGGRTNLVVKRGENYTLQFAPEAGWKIHSVTFNDDDITTLLDDQNRFTTPAMTTSATLNVAYEYVGVNDVNAAEVLSLRVKTVASGVEVSGVPEGTLISVYDEDGRLAGSAKAKIDATIVTTRLHSGDIAIVKVDGKTVKMVMR